MSDGETKDSSQEYEMIPHESKSFEFALFSLVDYNAKIYKYNLKTSMFIKANEVDKFFRDEDETSNFKFMTIAGANHKLRIIKGINHILNSMVLEVVDHKQYDVFYLVVVLVSYNIRHYEISTTFSNDTEKLESKRMVYYIVFGVIAGVIVIGFILCIVCCRGK